MAEMNDDEEVAGGGLLSQDELDALLAAASAEATGDEWTEEASGAETEAEPAAAPPAGSSAGSTLVDLPSFDMPALAAAGPDPTGLLIRDILDLGAGSIIELDKLAGEPVELYANGLLMARGEVVVIDDNFGIRVTEIITAADRKSGKDAHALAA
jgi:flagellar motor switch protein FliN/FliY